MMLNVQSEFMVNLPSCTMGKLINGIHLFHPNLEVKLKFKREKLQYKYSSCVSVPIISVNKSTDFLLLGQCESVFKEGFFVYYFALVTLVPIIITIILMSQNSDNAQATEETLASDTVNKHYDPDLELSRRLLRQVIHNQNNPNRPLNYQSFPEDHDGHLTIQLKEKLVSILRSSVLADNYRFGTSVGTIYLRGTYRRPQVTPEMAGVVYSIESKP